MDKVQTLKENYKRASWQIPDDHFLLMIIYINTKLCTGRRSFGAFILVLQS